jgi:PKD repeat protein
VILYDPNNADNIYLGNDGGVYMTQNAKAATPIFTPKNRNYNVTQFYSCAIHPTAGKDWFIAGSQDNGTQLFENSKIVPTKTITAGDGAFVHIHRDTPNVQMSAYVYSQYFFTKDNWTTQTARTISTKRGSFINPSDYDYRSNFLYAGYEAGKITTLKVDGIKTGSLVITTDTPTVATLGTAKVTAVTVSPNTANVVYFGLNNGDVVKIDNAHLSSRSSTVIRTGGGGISVSSIAVENGNSNHLIVTYSNYGITSIYETQNGGTSWLSIENNLPDMPIRWAIFNPNNANQVAIATEIGVWSTDNLNGTLTAWGPSTGGLANVRTNMLKYRESDNLLLAATHGRGLFSSDVFSNPTALFTAENPVIYAGKAVQFANTSLKDVQWAWNFGDGSTDNTENPLHTYAHPGYYNVNLTINNGASSKTINSLVHVLPYMGTPYTASAGGDFETIGQFEPVTTFGELQYSTFERGNPLAGTKAGTASGVNAWATGSLTANYLSNSTAMLYTPCYSFLLNGNYTIKFKARFNLQTQYDGFQVQYSLDKGDTWSVLGAYDPTTWYNYNNLGTAFPLGEPMFSGLAALAGGVFTDFSYSTSALAGNSFVAFRFVFKSDGTTNLNGAVIDDFEIDGPLNTPLPVDITEFNGDYKDSKVILNWHTNSETNCKGFEVQRSLDGQSFEILGWRDGNGSTATPHSYTFNDDDIRASTQYYRLKQIDFDGSFEYSDIIQVFIFPENEANMYVYPNPFVSDITIRMFEPITTSERIRVKLIDKNGIILASIPVTDAPPIKQIALDLSPYNLASGVYYLELYEKGVRIGTTQIVRR